MDQLSGVKSKMEKNKVDLEGPTEDILPKRKQVKESQVVEMHFQKLAENTWKQSQTKRQVKIRTVFKLSLLGVI